jgi:hypothetical protein
MSVFNLGLIISLHSFCEVGGDGEKQSNWELDCTWFVYNIRGEVYNSDFVYLSRSWLEGKLLYDATYIKFSFI